MILYLAYCDLSWVILRLSIMDKKCDIYQGLSKLYINADKRQWIEPAGFRESKVVIKSHSKKMMPCLEMAMPNYRQFMLKLPTRYPSNFYHSIMRYHSQWIRKDEHFKRSLANFWTGRCHCLAGLTLHSFWRITSRTSLYLPKVCDGVLACSPHQAWWSLVHMILKDCPFFPLHNHTK